MNFVTYRTTSHSSLSQHRIAQHKTDERKEKYMIKCNFCDFTTLRSSYLSRHIKSINEGLKYRCEQDGCDFEAVKKETLLWTTEEHFPRGRLRFKCDKCDFESTNPQIIINLKRSNTVSLQPV